MNKKDLNIRSYDGSDAFYSGSDAEYEEFLKNADVRLDTDEAEAVENTQRINLNETINLQNVIDKFKKTAGDLGHTAKLFRNNVADRVDAFKAKKEEEKAETPEENDGFDFEAAKDAVGEKLTGAMQASQQKMSEIKEEVHTMADMPSSLEAVSKQLDALSEKLSGLEGKLTDDKKDSDKVTVELIETLKSTSDSITEIKQAVGSVSKLNDSVFDLKNTQLNTKNAVSNLETAFARLKKKCVLGVTVLSILSAIVIVLEIVLMLS